MSWINCNGKKGNKVSPFNMIVGQPKQASEEPKLPTMHKINLKVKTKPTRGQVNNPPIHEYTKTPSKLNIHSFPCRSKHL